MKAEAVNIMSGSSHTAGQGLRWLHKRLVGDFPRF